MGQANTVVPPASGGANKIQVWKGRLALSDAAFSAEAAKMDERERLYSGDKKQHPLVAGDLKIAGGLKKTPHVRNIIFENIESQVNPSIPYPKVTPRRKQDERLAEIIEHFLRNEIDRLPFETINDMAERTVPIQGGVGFLVEWDNTKRTHHTVGEVDVRMIHPKQFAPQPGVFTGIHDMDWFIIKVPSTKEAIRRRYGVDVDAEGESEPDVRTGAAHQGGPQADAVTQYIGFAKNDGGGVDRYSWVNEIELEDLVNYQARRLDGEARDCEERVVPDDLYGFRVEEIPYYTPDIYPVVLQRSVSVYGQLLGNSDVDVIRDQQNSINRMSQKIIDRIVKAGTRITLPNRADMRNDPVDGERWFIDNPADMAMIGVYNFSGDVSQEMSFREAAYNEARQVIGITDSFQGRRDTTATSGKAKEFAAAQAAGRLESKRVMKEAAYADMFELMFKFWLAYSDEPRPVVYKNSSGDNEYMEFNRYDFLEVDESGAYCWNDQFLFSCDASASLASNREAMWQETRMNLQTGAFGDPASLETLIMFWAKMEELHYPGAGGTKKFLEERLEREQTAPPAAESGTPGVRPLQGGEFVPPEIL
jgi:hypothetical protein